MPIRKKRTDANQAAIVTALRDVGATVRVTSGLGCGIPDLMVMTRRKHVIWIEAKMPGEKLTPAEKEFFEWWSGLAYLAYSPEQAVEIVECLDQGE